MIPLSSTKIMQKKYFWDCDYKTYDFVFSRFSIKFCFGRMKCFSHWLSLILPAPRVRQRVWQATPSGNFFQPCAKPATRTFVQLSKRYPWALPLQDFQHPLIIMSLIVHINARGDWRACLSCCSVIWFSFSQRVQWPRWRKACGPDQCPAGVLAGDRVLIKVFADNIPPLTASSLSF